LTQALKSKEKRKGSAKKGLEEKRGKKGEILGEPYPRERKRNERNEKAQEQHPKTCRNINSPRQFNTQRCNATKKKSHGNGKIIPFNVEVWKEWKREEKSRDRRERA